MKRRVLKTIIRLLCALIDYIILMLPVQLLMIGIMRVEVMSVDFLFRLLFAVYGFVMITTFDGVTVGKIFGKIKVVDKDGGKATALYVGLRELVKSMYLIPVVGWIFLGISIVLLLVRDTSIHDMVGRTRVILKKEDREVPDDRE